MADINQTATVTTKVNGEQAEEEIKKLTNLVKGYKQELNKAYQAGDKKAVKHWEKEISNANKSIKLLKASLFDVDSVLKNLSGASINDISRAIKGLNSQLNSGKIKRGSKEWDEYTKKIRLLKTELANIKMEMRATQSTWERMNNAFNKWGAMAASVVASITGISLAFSQMRKMAYAQEESAANLKALTGLDDRSIEWLKQQAAELSTTMTESGVRIRQSSTEILEAYMLVGSAKPDLLQNKEALNQVTTEALKLATAAKMDMKEAVDAVTLSMNQYGAAANEAARYTNVMAAGSKYGSANVQSVTTAVIKSGVAASAANIPIEQLVGTIETLAEKGIKDDIAGTGLKNFFLRLQKQTDDVNPKIVGLQTALENLAAKQLSVTEMISMFGEEGYQVAQALISSADAVNYYTQAVTGTAVAEEQAAINSQTRQAKLEQMKNQMAEVAIQIVNDLNPAMVFLGNSFTNMLKILPPVIKFIKEFGGVIVSTGASILAYVAYQKAHNLIVNGLTISYKRLLVQIRAFYRTILKTNPWGAIVGVISVTIGVIAKFVRENNKLTESMKAQQRIAKKTEDQYAEQAGKIDMLIASYRNENIALDQRKKALDEIKRIVPGYHAQLTEEGKLINDNADAVRNYLTQLEKQIRLQALQEELTELYKRKVASDKKVNEYQKNYDRAYSYAGTLTGQAQNSAYINAANFEKTLNKAKNEQKEITDAIAVLEEELNASGLFTVGYEDKIKAVDEWLTKELNLIKEKLNEKLITENEYEKESLQAEIEASKKKLDILEKAAGKESAIYQSTYSHYLDLQRQLKQLDKNGTVNPLTDDDPTNDKKKKYEELLKLVDNWLTRETNMLKEKRNAQLLKEDEYQKGTVQLALEAAQRKLDILKAAEGEESAIYQNAYSRFLDIQHQLNNPQQQEDDTVVTDDKDKKRNQALKQFGLWTDEMELNQSLSILEQYYANALLNEDEYQQARQALLDAYNQKEIEKEKAKREKITDFAFQSLDQILGATDSYINAAADAEVAKTEAKYDRMIEAAGNNTAQQEQLEKQKEDAVAKIRAENADKSFGIQIAMAIAQGAASIVRCFSDLGPIAGAIAAIPVAATTALQIATMKQQHSAAKANYWTGGYTPDGAWNEEQGTVHSGEFVANRFAVRNPAIRPVLDLIDTAQKNNTIASITSTDVSRSLGNSPSAPSVVALDASYFDAATQRFGYAAERLSKQLDKPIEATVTIEGRNGLAEQWDKYNRLNKNKGN